MRFERAVVRLEYACADCGELVETNTEPCPNCGAATFEKLHETTAEPEPFEDEVRVRAHPKEQALASDIVWECRNCGRRHMRNSPPCDRCGHPTLEKVVLDRETDDIGPTGLQRFLRSGASMAGLALAAIGGVVMLYGGLVGAGTRTFELTGRLPPEQRVVVFAGFLVLAAGAGLLLLGTRRTVGFEE